jgi:hypothetical protein
MATSVIATWISVNVLKLANIESPNQPIAARA